MWIKRLKHLWHLFLELSGEDAYERYLKHHVEYHANVVDARPALTRKEFYMLMQEKKWQGVNRCC